MTAIVTRQEAIAALKVGYYCQKIEQNSQDDGKYLFISLIDEAIIRDAELYEQCPPRTNHDEVLACLQTGFFELEGEEWIVSEEESRIYIKQWETAYRIPITVRLKLSPPGFLSQEEIAEDKVQFLLGVRNNLATPEKFLNWLNHYYPEHIVGMRNSNYFCPIARYIVDVYKVNHVSASSVQIFYFDDPILCDLGFIYSCSNKHTNVPEWIQKFIKTTDTINLHLAGIKAGEAIATLQTIISHTGTKQKNDI